MAPSAARLLISLLAGLLSTVTVAASPRDELLRLVPDDVHFCAVVQNLRERARTLTDTSLAAQIAGLPFVKAKFDSAEFKKLIEIEKRLLQDLQVTPEQLRDDILGDTLVFAFRQGATEKPEDEQGLFLIWARDVKLLNAIVDRINELQTQTGELKELRSLSYGNQDYRHRSKVKNETASNEYYLIRGNILVFSHQERIIRAVIDRDRNQPSAAKEQPFWSKMLQQLGFEKALVALLFSPRNFDAELAGKRDKSVKADERAFLQEFYKYWQACDGLGLSGDIGPNLEVSLAVHLRKDALPKPAQQFFREFSKASALWNVIPEDALLAISSRIDFAALIELFGGFCDSGRLKEISDSVESSMKPFSFGAFQKGLGPDWGIWAFAPAPKDKTWVPQVLFAIKVQNNPDGVAAEKAVRDAVQFLATLAQFNKSSVRVGVMNFNNTEIRYLSNDTVLPTGLRPAFASKDGYLLFAGSPEVIQRFAPPVDAGGKEEIPVVRISATGWKNYLSDHRNEVADFLEKTIGLPGKDGIERIGIIVDNLKAIDRFEIAVKSKADQATIVLRLKGNMQNAR